MSKAQVVGGQPVEPHDTPKPAPIVAESDAVSIVEDVAEVDDAIEAESVEDVDQDADADVIEEE